MSSKSATSSGPGSPCARLLWPPSAAPARRARPVQSGSSQRAKGSDDQVTGRSLQPSLHLYPLPPAHLRLCCRNKDEVYSVRFHKRIYNQIEMILIGAVDLQTILLVSCISLLMFTPAVIVENECNIMITATRTCRFK